MYGHPKKKCINDVLKAEFDKKCKWKPEKNPLDCIKSGTRQFPPGKLPPGQFLSGQLPPRTIAPRQFPSRKMPPNNCTWKISSQDNWPSGQMTPGHLPPRTIPIRLIAPRGLCRLEFFYCLSFRLHIKITFKTSWNMQHLSK